MGDYWKDYGDIQQKRRRGRLQTGMREIVRLREFGYSVERKTDFQWRVNEEVDLYPIHKRYHVLRTGKRGDYHNATALILSVLPLDK